MSARPRRFELWPRSLERRLPIMIGTLLTAVVLVFGFAAYRDVQRSARDNAQRRLETVSEAVSQSVQTLMSRRVATLAPLIEAPGVDRAFAGGEPSRRLLARISATSRGSDSLVIAHELRSPSGELLASSSPAELGARDAQALQRLLASAAGEDNISGALYRVGDELRYWVLVAAGTGSQPAGYVTELRRLVRTPQIEAQLRALTGQEMDLYFSSAGADFWATASGSVVPRPSDVRLTDRGFTATVDGEAVMGVATPVEGTKWVMLFTIPQSTIEQRALALVQRMLPFALALLLSGAIAAWFVSRGVTRPLRSLADVANAIAAGDYSRRVARPEEEELGQLADAFNSMTERVGQSHHELEARNEELRAAQQDAIFARNTSELARVEAQRANDAKTSFLAMMSHELRTPLSAIGGYTEILQLGLRGELNDAQQADLERIRTNQAHLLTIINDMLDLSQIESGQLSVSCEPVALDVIFSEVDPIVAPTIAAKRLTFEIDPSVRLLHVHADRERLRQILINLLSNASRFSNPGGAIAIHATVRSGRVALHVTDTGIGIPEEKLGAIFEPFVQVDSGPTRRTGGTGLGLPISRRLAEAMDGKLEVASEVGVGSTFTLDLRAAEPSAHKPELRLVHGRLKQTA